MLRRVRSLANNETARVVAFLTTWKALFVGFVFFAIETFPRLIVDAGWRANFHFPKSAPPPEWLPLQTWDAQHYLYLAEYGYLPGDSSTAFFPLWPYCIKAVAPLFGGSYLIAGLVLANAMSIVALTLLWRFVLRERGERAIADTALLLALAFPGSLFFGFVYSEALFFLLAVFVVSELARDHWRAACLGAFFLPLVRGVGVFIAVPMLYVFVRQWRTSRAFPVKKALGLAAPLAGVAVYFLFMYLETGNLRQGFDAQRQFISTRALSDLVDVWALLTSLVDFQFGHGYQSSILDRLFFVVFLASLVYLWRNHRLLFFYALPLGLIPPMTSFMSYTRYLVVVFPLFVAGGEQLAPAHRRHLRWAVVGLMLALQALLTVRYVNFLWAG